MAVSKRKVLVVEDEEVLRESVRDWLVEDGYDVECVATGEEALARMKAQEFGVVVLDLRLPGIDGLQVFEQAKELKSPAKGIIMTAYPSKETMEKAKRLGLLDYLAKPFKVEDLEKTIAKALGEIEAKAKPKEHVWLELGAVSYRVCTQGYECGKCDFAQDMQEKFGTIAVMTDAEVAKAKSLPGGQRLCRYAAMHFVSKDR